MSSYILVHGAWHGAWCWERLIPLLEREGHRVDAPDLPGHGSDQTPLSAVTLDSCMKRVGQALLAAPEPSFLVGHSMAGAVISQAAERFPERIRCLVYVTAFLLSDGQSRRHLPDVGTSIVQQNLIFSEDHESVEVDANVRRQAFYGECSNADAGPAAGRLGPTPSCLFTTAVTLSDERYGQVPRVYIECLKDQAIPPRLQRAMQAAVPCGRTFSINTDHSPFLSAPEELARLLLAVNATSDEMLG